MYDLDGATAGDIDPDIPDANGDTPTFEHLRFLETTFDGFAFGRKRDALRDIDWAVHQPRDRGHRDIAIAAQKIALGDGYTRSAFGTARDVAALLVAGTAIDILENPDADDEADQLDALCSIPPYEDFDGYRVRSVTHDGGPHADLLRAYLEGSGRVISDLGIEGDPDDGGRGDPVSRVFGRGESVDPPGGSREAVIDRVRELRASLREAMDGVNRAQFDMAEIAESLMARLFPGVATPALDDVDLDLDFDTVALETAVARDIADPERAVATDSEAESTYAEEKKGASDAGDETAAGNFFEREAQYGRRQHWQRWRDRTGLAPGLIRLATSGLAVLVGALFLVAGVLGLPTPLTRAIGAPIGPGVSVTIGAASAAVGVRLGRRRLDALFDWFGNLFFLLTMGYGEKPQRVLGFSGVIVAAFGLVYWATGADIGTLAAYGPVGYVVLSLQLFATLLVGT
ncbi:MAG: hypothetical protein ABEH58_03500, partial [Haloplanus sp.]